ncbi:asparagine synthase-related protein [Acinetobacter baumannii]|uniref:asparagine synthase-related protein n=1 Tax=Acinetobacter baumannii TaxID=470 RepID=UPI002449DA8A|nr:asparagine synthase-related protein [Acinetobacter baumannii]MDH2534919.1 asparagine synthase-related protein [Acinetobacter baumannii]
MLHRIPYSLNNNISLYKDIINIQINNKNDITIKNKYNSNTTFYIDFYKDYLEISDQFYELESFSKKNINLNQVNNYFKNMDLSSNNFFLRETKILYHGCKLKKNNKTLIIDEIERKNHKLDPVESLNLAMEYISTEQNIAISFSGGLDSTAIIFTIKEKFPYKNIVAFTWKNKGSSNEDLKHAISICNDLSIQLIILEIKPEHLLQELDKEKHVIPTYPSTYLASLNFVEYYVTQLDKYFKGQRFTIINGHGGDHIFFETIPLNLLNFDFIINWNKIKDYSLLYSDNYFKLIKSILLNTFNINSKISFENFRKKLVDEAKFQTSTTFIKLPEHINIFFPFVTPEMITCGENYSLFDSFNEKFTRIHFRNSFYNKFNSQKFFRINKGHMTGAYQRSIKLNYEKFEKILDSSFIFEKKILDKRFLINHMKLSSIGVNGITPQLINLLMLEMIMKVI